MVLYVCPRCGFNNKIKTKYTIHLRRKILCKPKVSDDNLYYEYVKYNIEEKIVNFKNIQKSSKNPQKIPQKKNNIPKKSSKNTQKISKNKCNFCDKKLSSYKNLWRHLKTCKEKRKMEEADKTIKELVNLLNIQIEEQRRELEKKDKELEKRNNQIDELIKKAGIQNSTITQNIQNNIKLLAYKDTDISNISDKDIMKCLNHNNMCVPHLIKMIHLNPRIPENHNIYISNLKNGYIMVYDGDKWTTLNREDVIDNLINDKQCLIEERIENWIENGQRYPTIMKKFERYLEKKENNVVLDKIKEEIKLMLFNNKNLVKTMLIEDKL